MLAFQIISTLILILIGGILYRLGGAAKTNNWYSFLQNTKSRDLGVPVCEMLIIWLWSGIYIQLWWGYLLSFGAAFGCMTTYWKKKGTEAKWYNWMFTGLGYSISLIPYAVSSGDWLGFFLRAAVLTTAFTLWKTFQGNAVVSEIGAGCITVAATVLMAIGFKKPKDK